MRVFRKHGTQCYSVEGTLESPALRTDTEHPAPSRNGSFKCALWTVFHSPLSEDSTTEASIQYIRFKEGNLWWSEKLSSMKLFLINNESVRYIFIDINCRYNLWKFHNRLF